MKKTNTFKQALSHLVVHFVACLFIFLVMMPIIGGASSNTTLSVILGIVMALIYAYFMFSTSYECAAKDHKPYSETTPYPFKGLILSLGVIVPVIITWIFYVIAWKAAPIPETVDAQTSIPVITFTANMVYSFFTSPFWNFVAVKGSTANLAGQLVSLAVPAAACFAGYYLGYIKFDYTKYINKIVYDKKKK
ncbi:MAG: hypothetical protein IJ300_03400 [Clostridia bacterium]|nr:hypothetical protein [Clostridia bacterium]